jgi:uncharacterized membrane protein
MLAIIGGVAGGIGGYLYYYYVGCTSGGCPITSSPVMSVIWGALMGGLLLSMFKKENKKSGSQVYADDIESYDPKKHPKK